MTYVFLIFLSAAFARDGLDVTCEHALFEGSNLAKAFEAQIMDRVFLMNGREPGVRPAAYRKLELPPGLTEKSWHNIVLSVHRPLPRRPEDLILRVGRFIQGDIDWNLEMGSLEDMPVLWRVLPLGRSDRDLPYAALRRKFPLSHLGVEAFDNEFIGYATQTDVKGVRTYIAARTYADEDNVTIDLGLDVPCGDWNDYATNEVVARLVRTPVTNYCRLSIFSFSAALLN